MAAPIGERPSARLTGLLYLLLGFPAGFAYLYIPRRFVVPGDPASTAARIIAHPMLYRLGVPFDVLGIVLWVVVALRLYDLLKDADIGWARAMVALVLVSVSLQLANTLTFAAPLLLLGGGAVSSVFATQQLDALVMASLQLRTVGLAVANIFWGLWLVPLGILALKSRRAPKAVACAEFVACFGYVGGALLLLLVPGDFPTTTRFMLPLQALGEMPMMFWLAIRGLPDPGGLDHTRLRSALRRLDGSRATYGRPAVSSRSPSPG